MTACVVFDFDGTIVDTEEPLYVSWSELWSEHGHELDRSFWQTLIGTDDGFDPWVALEQQLGRRLDPSHEARRRARRDGLIDARGVEAGVLEWLADAERLGVPVGIASSSSPAWVERHLVRLGMRDRFACLSCADGVIPPKPDPTSFRQACQTLGADVVLSVAVEDSPHGVAAATAAGLFTVAVPPGLTVDLDFSAADLVVDSLEHLTLEDAPARAASRSGTRPGPADLR